MNKRQEAIRTKLEERGAVRVSDLVQELGVCEMTIRRDLTLMEKHHIVHRVHGGAILIRTQVLEPSYAQRSSEDLSEKRLIAEAAKSLVKDHSTIALDCGTTTVELCKCLLDRQDLTIVTTSAHVIALCLGHPNLRVIVPGGTVRPVEGSIIGSNTLKFLSSVYVSQFFLGIGALDLHAGVTDFSAEDSDIKKILIANAQQVIGLADHSKLNKVCFAKVCDLSQLDYVVIDGKINEAYRNAFQQNGVTLVNPLA